MNVFLDDERSAPAGWIRTYNVPDTIKLLETGEVECLSLDHDLGVGVVSGQAVTLWLRERVYWDPSFRMPRVFLHTMNPVGRDTMKADLRWIRDLLEKRAKGVA